MRARSTVHAGERSAVFDQDRLLSARRNSCTDLLSSRKPRVALVLRCIAPRRVGERQRRAVDFSDRGKFAARQRLSAVCRRYPRTVTPLIFAFLFTLATPCDSPSIGFITGDKAGLLKLTKRRNDPEFMCDITL